jgi:hypothetical protein
MITSRHMLVLVLVGLLGFAAHCTSSTSVVSSWHDQGYRSGSLHKPLVVAAASTPVVRVKIEDSLVRELRGIGVDAVASHAIFPQSELTAAIIKDKLPSTDRDSVMVTHLVDVKHEVVVVPEQTEVYGGYPAYADRWGTYYAHSYTVVTSPAYAYETKKYILQTNLYDAADEKLVWTVVTESQEPASLDDAIAAFAGVVVKNVEQNRLF